MLCIFTTYLVLIAPIYIQRCQHCQQHQYASIIIRIHLYCLADRKLRYALVLYYILSLMYFFLFNYSMRYDTASSTYTLQIKDVQRPDEGTYQCQIIVAINNKVTKSVDLTVAAGNFSPEANCCYKVSGINLSILHNK